MLETANRVDKIKGYTERCCVQGKDNTINAGEAAERNNRKGQHHNTNTLEQHKKHPLLNNNDLNISNNAAEISVDDNRLLHHKL